MVDRTLEHSLCLVQESSNLLLADRFCIAHEAGHLIHRDHQLGTAMLFAFPLIDTTVNKLEQASVLFIKKRTVPGILSAVAPVYIFLYLNRNYWRFMEKRADLFEDNPEIIQGGIDFFKFIKRTQEIQTERDISHSHSPKRTQFLLWLQKKYKKFTDVHPPLEKRIAYLEKHLDQRLAEIKQKGKQEAQS